MTSEEISKNRIANQKISKSEFKTAKELVSWMGAMQAQDYNMAKWAIGLRVPNSTDKQIETAFNNGEIIRTHLMRPTWHFVANDDLCWMLELTAPQIKTNMMSGSKNYELDTIVLNKCYKIIEHALSGGKNLTRDELKTQFSFSNIDLYENRLSYILQHAEINGLICSGPMKANKHTFSLLDERIKIKKIFTKDQALAELAIRYFTSHSPATLKDFAWWSGLSVKDSRKALDFVKSSFISEKIGEDIYWFSDTNKNHANSGFHLLPAYDEFLISYKNRTASLANVDNKKAISSNGIFYPVIVDNGQVCGLWKRTLTKDNVIIKPDFFKPNNIDQHKLIKAATTYENFIGKKMIFEL